MNGLFVASYVVLWVLVVALSAMVLLLYRHFGLVAMNTAEGHERDGLPIGDEAPPISGVNIDNERIEWVPPVGQHTLLVFALPGCEPCEQIMPFLGIIDRATERTPFSVVLATSGRGDAAEALAKAAGPGVVSVADDGSGAMENYRAVAAPFAFLIGPDRRILAKGNCSNQTRLRRLLATANLAEPITALERAVQQLDDTSRTPLKALILEEGSDVR